MYWKLQPEIILLKKNSLISSGFSMVLSFFVIGLYGLSIMLKSSLLNKLLVLTAFSIAMGYLESAVVVYFREIVVPWDFQFDVLPKQYMVTEILRELSTMIMLISVAFLAGKTLKERFASFIFCFAFWDIFYYVFLKLLINWPDSFFTWDILFLIPVPWYGPVLAPVLLAILMIIMAFILLNSGEKKVNGSNLKSAIWIMAVGSILTLVSFTVDFALYVIHSYLFSKWLMTLLNFSQFNYMHLYNPAEYKWPLFFAGYILLIGGVALLYFGYRKKRP